MVLALGDLPAWVTGTLFFLKVDVAATAFFPIGSGVTRKKMMHYSQLRVRWAN